MSTNFNKQTSAKVVLVTGAARRIGACVAEYFHSHGYRVVIHYNQSRSDAEKLAARFNATRQDSCRLWRCNLSCPETFLSIAEVLVDWQRLDVLVHNASGFRITKLGTTSELQWDDLSNSNVKGAFFLSQTLIPWLNQRQGSIISITDIHASRPMRDYSVYCIAKAALTMMTKSLAKELAPRIRVNAVAPGVAAAPEGDNSLDPEMHSRLLSRTPLARFGEPRDIAQAVWALAEQCTYITGQILTVDGGRSLNL